MYNKTPFVQKGIVKESVIRCAKKTSDFGLNDNLTEAAILYEYFYQESV